MYTIKTPSFLRPSSRPSSPAPTPSLSARPEGDLGGDRPARPLTKLSLTHFTRKPSPAPSLTANNVPLIQDGSFLESLSLKLSEAATKALAQPTNGVAMGDALNGKRPIPAGRGRALGELIAS